MLPPARHSPLASPAQTICIAMSKGLLAAAGKTIEQCVEREPPKRLVYRSPTFATTAARAGRSLTASWWPHCEVGRRQHHSGARRDRGRELVLLDGLPGIPPQFSLAGYLIRDTVSVLREGWTP